MPWEKVGCIPLAVVIMTTANGMQPTCSRWHTQLFLMISDLYRVITEFAEVHTDIA